MIFEGANINDSATLATFCGNLTESLPVIKSIGNTMTVSFNSDENRHFRGFKAAVN